MVAPRLVLVNLFGQPPFRDYAWLRVLGLHAFGLAMLMVLVAHRLEELWWWSWAFALVAAGTAAVVVLNAAFGLAPGQSSLLWWVLSAVTLIFAFGLLYGLAASSKERPLL